MGCEAFEALLGAIRIITAEQRGKVLRVLALAEADEAGDGGGFEPCLNYDADRPIASASVMSPFVDSDVLPAPDMATPASPSTPSSESVAVMAERRVESTGCPHCRGQKLQRWGRASGLPRYRCGDCRRTFNALTGTPLARLHKKDRWTDQATALMTGESVAKAAVRCGVAYTTAFRWRHRFLSAPALDKPTCLTGIVEADETFILESFKGKRSDLPRPARKRGGKAAKAGLSAEQIPVLVARDRNGATTDAVLPKLNRASVTAALAGVVTPANELRVCAARSRRGSSVERTRGIWHPRRAHKSLWNFHLMAVPGPWRRSVARRPLALGNALNAGSVRIPAHLPA